MHRLLAHILIGVAMLFATGAAHAGLRAIYIDQRQPRQLQIDVQDNGDTRIGEPGSPNYGLLIGGEFFVVDVEDGKPKVARLRDIASAIDKVLPPIFKGLFDKAGAALPPTHLKVEAGEPGEAGGRKGRIYHVRGLDESQPNKPTDFLISDDPELKPVGSALEQFMNAAMVPAAPLIGAGAVDLIAQTRTIFALGTPIVSDMFRLDSAGKATFPDDHFRLPAQPQTVEQLVAAMKASMQKKE